MKDGGRTLRIEDLLFTPRYSAIIFFACGLIFGGGMGAFQAFRKASASGPVLSSPSAAWPYSVLVLSGTAVGLIQLTLWILMWTAIPRREGWTNGILAATVAFCGYFVGSFGGYLAAGGLANFNWAVGYYEVYVLGGGGLVGLAFGMIGRKLSQGSSVRPDT